MGVVLERGHKWVTALVAAGALALAAQGLAQTAAPKTFENVRVVEDDIAVWTLPTRDSTRRGSLHFGAVLPLLQRSAAGAGCPDAWLRVGSDAWICGQEVSVFTSALPASPSSASGMFPFRHYFVGTDGTFGYSTLRLAEEGIPDSQLEPGFAVAVTEVRAKPDGERFALTTHGLWLPLRDLRAANPSSFRGYSFEGEPSDIGWVFEDKVHVYTAPGTSQRGTELPRLSLITIRKEQKRNGKVWLEIGDQRWVRSSAVRRWRRTTPVPELGASEHWIDIDIERQILTTYEGSRPTFATLVSTGKGKGDHPEATPLGKHRIWVKLRSQDMTNLEDVTQASVYAIEEVPWVMFFKQGYGLHGAFWHDSFGTKRSHGCVNLSPADSETVFRWATPQLPAGFSAILPTPTDPGTLVVIR